MNTVERNQPLALLQFLVISIFKKFKKSQFLIKFAILSFGVLEFNKFDMAYTSIPIHLKRSIPIHLKRPLNFPVLKERSREEYHEN